MMTMPWGSENDADPGAVQRMRHPLPEHRAEPRRTPGELGELLAVLRDGDRSVCVCPGAGGGLGAWGQGLQQRREEEIRDALDRDAGAEF